MKLTVHDLEEFVIADVAAGPLDAATVAACVAELETIAHKGASLVFLDFSHIDETQKLELGALHAALAELKGRHTFEIILVAEPTLTYKMMDAGLDTFAQLYAQRDFDERLKATQAVLREGFNKTSDLLEDLMVEAVQVGVQRWMGSMPLEIRPSTPNVDPLRDFVSEVKMTIDGGEFRLYLASSQATMVAMVEKILKTKVREADPVIADAACELLNYLTAYFGQKLGEQAAVVESGAPHLLEPDQIMALLDQSPKGQRVQTALGHFELWIEEAA